MSPHTYKILSNSDLEAPKCLWLRTSHISGLTHPRRQISYRRWVFPNVPSRIQPTNPHSRFRYQRLSPEGGLRQYMLEKWKDELKENSLMFLRYEYEHSWKSDLFYLLFLSWSLETLLVRAKNTSEYITGKIIRAQRHSLPSPRYPQAPKRKIQIRRLSLIIPSTSPSLYPPTLPLPTYPPTFPSTL